jgi:DNA polymerase
MAPPPWGGEDMPQIEYAAVNQKTRQWNRERTYGGKLVENIVQAVARDLLADAMLRAEERGYTPILDVHDEVITEVPEGFGSVKEFEALMSELPEWATGCPVAAEGWKGKRYRK